jgi:polysaccharide deacetylase 2 family uncharacterized protein YibQ
MKVRRGSFGAQRILSHPPPRRRRPKAEIVNDRRGTAGLAATIVMSLAGLLVGTLGGYLAEQPTGRTAYADSLDLRDAPLLGSALSVGPSSERLVRDLTFGEPERFLAPVAPTPRIIIVFDDMGLDRAAFDAVMQLPGPLTLSFLPYGKESRALAREAALRGHDVMLHLPMEPAGGADPGPGSLSSKMSEHELSAALDRNLAALDAYVGVNNHMGSKLTRDPRAMQTVLSVIKSRDLFFLDSLTTRDSVAARISERLGARIFVRDVFIDAEGGEESAMAQLRLVERIARETGFAVAIAHPRRETLKAIGPWLASAPARGFVLATISSLAPGSAAVSIALRD